MTTSTRSKATATAVLADGDEERTEHRTIHGVAISNNEITNGLNGKKKWVPDELERAAETLKGAVVTAAPNVGGLDVEGALVDTNHGERVRVGQIKDSAHEDDVGVVYEMDIENEDIYSALALGDLDVSIEASNPTGIDEDPETGATIMRGYEFDGMDVVEKGAARSNHTAAGPASNNKAIAALSAKDVSGMLDDADDGDEAALAASVHTPSWSGKTTDAASWADGSWGRPDKSQFDTDDLSEIGDHFIASTSGFSSPETYSDLKLPVVEPNGDLNLNGLRAANTRVSQTDGLGDKQSAAETKIENLASEEFDEDFGSDDEEAANADAEAAASEGDDRDRDLDDIESGEDTGLDDVETESDPDPDQEASADDTDDPDEGEVSADATEDMANESESQSDAESASDTEPETEPETDAESTPDPDPDPDPDSDDPADEAAPEDDDPETESTSGSEADEESTDENAAEDAETNVEGSEDDTPDSDADGDPDDGDSGGDDADTDAESESTMSNDTPDEDTSTDTENAANEADQSQSTDLNLDGQVVIDEERHDELKTKAALAEDLEDELEETKRDLNKREEQIDTVHDVYSAALAEAGPHSEEFYSEMPLETLRNELRNTQDAEDDQAALEESVKEEQPLPQTGDQSADDGADEAALEAADETAKAALRLDDTAALAQSEQSPREFVQENHGIDATEYDDDIELRDAIYNGSGATAGGDD